MWNDAKEVLSRTVDWACASETMRLWHEACLREYEAKVRQKAVEEGVLRTQPAHQRIGEFADCIPASRRTRRESCRYGL